MKLQKFDFWRRFTLSVCGGALMLGALPSSAESDQSSDAKLGSASRVVVGSVIGRRGGRVTVPISFRGDGDTTGFRADVSFVLDNPNIVLSGPPNPVPVGGAECFRVPGSPNTIRVSRSTGAPLPSEIRYCDVKFTIPAGAPGGTEVLSVSNTVCTDGTGGDLPCQTTPGQVRISSIQTSLTEGTNIVIAGYTATVEETRRLRITNLASTNLSLSCALSPQVPGLVLSAAPTSILPGAFGDVIARCTLPPLGQPDLLSVLRCTTSDPVRGLLTYPITCTTVPDGEPLPGDQIQDNQLDAGAQLGASAAQSTVSSNGSDVVALGAPFGGAEGGGRVVLIEGQTQVSTLGDESLLKRGELSGKRLVISAPRDVRGDLPVGVKFGAAVSMSRDGQRLAVGAPEDGNTGRGAVYVYLRPATGWSDFEVNESNAVVVIQAPGALSGVLARDFGRSIAFTVDQDLVIGAPLSDFSGILGAGAVFFFPRNGNAFAATPEVLASLAPRTNGGFGRALAMGSDFLVVGAPREGTAEAGAAYRFEYNASSDTFLEPTAIPNSSAAAGSLFGSSVAINGTAITIGAPGATTTRGEGSGLSYMYFRPSPGGAVIESTILLPAAGARQNTGQSIAMNGDVIIVGAPGANNGAGEGQGRVYVYALRTGPGAPPTQSPLQQLEGIGTSAGDQFGQAVAASATRAVVGSPLRDLLVEGQPPIEDVGRGDPFILNNIFKSGFE